MKRTLLAASFCFISAVSAQTFNIEPASPVLAGEPVSISLSGLPTSMDVKVSAERVIAAFGQGA